MPFAKLTLHPSPSPQIKEHLAVKLTDQIVRDLGKKRELTSVLVESDETAFWAIGARSRDMAAHFEVCVTAGTNSEDQKRQFISSAMQHLKDALPGLHMATYVVVRELPATSWGYDGQTQADRAQ